MATNEELKDLLDQILNATKCIQELMPSNSAEFNEIKHYLKEHSKSINQILTKQSNPEQKMFKYKLVSVNGEKLFPNCVEDYMGYFSRYEYESLVELFSGDYIRVTDDNYGIGMAKVVRRVYSSNYHTMYLVCENMDPTDDYIYTIDYEIAVNEFVDHNKQLFKYGELPSADTIGSLVDKLTTGKTMVDHWNVLQRTHELLEKKLGYTRCKHD